MATTVHIPLEELPADARALLERARSGGDIFIDDNGEGYKISRLPGRTASKALALLQNSPNADVEVDDEWSKDMADIIALRYSETYRDPWA